MFFKSNIIFSTTNKEQYPANNLIISFYMQIILSIILLPRKEYIIMHNNKNRMKDREKSNAELRKMEPKSNADVGIKNGHIIGVHEGQHEKSRPKNNTNVN